MSRVFVTGSSDGLGLMAARLLIEQGHEITLHARNAARAEATRRALPQAGAIVVGDVSSIAETRRLADQVNALGRHDAVIHNVGIGSRSRGAETADGLPPMLAVNVLAPYVLTALVTRPDRLVYVSSGMHMSGDAHPPDRTTRRWNVSYSDSKLLDVMLAFAVARRWPDINSNAIEPGWVPTKMGGPNAPDDLILGAVTQVWLAVSDEPAAKVTGQYFFHQKPRRVHPDAQRTDLQDALLAYCAELTGVALPS